MSYKEKLGKLSVGDSSLSVFAKVQAGKVRVKVERYSIVHLCLLENELKLL